MKEIVQSQRREQKNTGMREPAEMNTNQVIMSGIVETPLMFSHCLYRENFYTLDLMVCRKSGRVDRIPLIIPERLIEDKDEDYRGRFMEIRGQFRSFNKMVDGKNRLILTVYVQMVVSCRRVQESVSPVNSIYIDGFISRKPYYRRTPTGREITEMMLAVNRLHASDYIPCICWGRNARLADKLELGTRLRVWGRIQSRTYRKWVVLPDGGEESYSRTVHEISIGRMELPMLAA